MEMLESPAVLDRLVSPLGDCLTPESARRLIELKPDPLVQARVDDLAGRHTEGDLTAAERAEYGRLVNYATFMAILKSRARRMLAE